MESITVTYWQWGLVLLTGLVFLIASPRARSFNHFFYAETARSKPGFWLLLGSLIISWIFAKSITNAANLGQLFGLYGGIAYAAYYFSFVVAGIVIYQLRTSGNFTSIHEFLTIRFGRPAVVIFTGLIAFRLFNEIWSNTMVIGSYFGGNGSQSYYLAIVVFTLLTLAYTLKGGMSSSLFTDAIQMILFVVLLGFMLAILLSSPDFQLNQITSSTEFSWSMGGNLFLAAILQSLSYPFHDPVMTDRGFIAKPQTTLKSFLHASWIGALLIVLFSLIGLYGRVNGIEGNITFEVAKRFGPVVLLVINFIMITSAASTIDSTFSSSAKLFTLDLKLGHTISFGRMVMIFVAVLGTIPIFLNASILSATTISGTMVIGLTPVFIFWKVKAPSLSFYLSIGVGVIIGIILSLGLFPKELIFTNGKYGDLLWANIFGVILCNLVYFLSIWIAKKEK